jgi:hypothetical protein
MTSSTAPLPAAPTPEPTPPPAVPPVAPAVPPPALAAAPRPRRWPLPAEPAGPVPLAAAAMAGLAFAASIVDFRPGLGWGLAALVAAAGVGASWFRPGPAGTGPAALRRVETLLWGLVTVGLLAVGAFRAAEWLFGLCVLAAAGTFVLAVTGGRTVRGLLAGALLVPVAAVYGAVWARRGLRALRGDAGREDRGTFRVGLTVAATALVVLVFGSLFSSADAAFSRLLGYALPDVNAGSVVRWVVLFGTGAGGLLAATLLLVSPPGTDRPGGAGARRVRRAEWATPVGAMVVLFAGFVAVQLAVLFGGAAHVLGPDGPSYAEYARGGFWQLLLVTLLTLTVAGVVARVAPRDARPDRLWLRVLLGALCGLTLVIVASALVRMHTYQEAYGFTRLRLLVSLAELCLGLVFLLVLAAGVRLRAAWLPRAVAATAAAALLGLVALNPDRFIADRNIDRWAAGGGMDVGYLAGLSADAVPALMRLPSPVRECALQEVSAALTDTPDDWRSANLARTIARRHLAADPPQPIPAQRWYEVCAFPGR